MFIKVKPKKKCFPLVYSESASVLYIEKSSIKSFGTGFITYAINASIYESIEIETSPEDILKQMKEKVNEGGE